jgi:hypothetical protein
MLLMDHKKQKINQNKIKQNKSKQTIIGEKN